MSQPPIFHFDLSPLTGGKVDRANGVIKGVSLITSGVTARGHDLEVDDTTLTQMLECGQAKAQVPVKINHQSGVENVCGFINTFRIQNGKLLGDWHLMKSHSEYESMMEKAERMPSCFGLSGAFLGDPEVIAGKGKKKRRIARCTELLAVDCVAQPAANPDGLFNANYGGVDTPENANMPKEPTLADLMALLTAQGERQAAFEEQITGRFDALEQQAAQNDSDPLTNEELEELSGMSDQELAGLGITRAEVQAAVADASGGEGAGEGEGAAQVTTAAGAGADSGVSGALASLQRQVSGLVTHLEAGQRAQEEAQVENAFAVIESKVTELTSLVAVKDAEIQALRHAFETGESRPLGSGVEATNLFSADEDAGQFQQLVTAKTTELMAAGKLTEVQAKAQAVQFCVRKYPAAYQEFRANPKGVTKL